MNKEEILEYLEEPFIKSVMQRAEKGEETMHKYIAEIINTFKTQANIEENNAMVFHYVLSLLFSAMTEIETLKDIIKSLLEDKI